MPAPECSVSKMQNSQPAFAMIWLMPGVKNSNAMWPSATPPLRSFARTGLPRIAPPVLPKVRAPGRLNHRREYVCRRGAAVPAKPLAYSASVCDTRQSSAEARSMSVVLGSGDDRYRVVENWAKLPDGWNLTDVAAVAV